MPVPRKLPIFIDPLAPITINIQIAEQIKLLIAIGKLRTGDTLPTVTQLARYLGVNHNTIMAVYNYLIESGYLSALKGRGTFVADTQSIQNIITNKQFYYLLEQAFNSAAMVGLSPSEFGAAAYAQAVSLSHYESPPLKLVFVEHLQNGVGIYEAIQSEISRPLLFLSLSDLSANNPNALQHLAAADLVITRAQHLSEVTQITTDKQEVIGVNTQPDLQLLTQISSLPRDALILLVDKEEGDSDLMKQMLKQVGISHVNFQVFSLERLTLNPQILLKVDAVCISKLVEESVRQYASQPKKMMIFNFTVDQISMSVLNTRLAVIQSAKTNSILP